MVGRPARSDARRSGATIGRVQNWAGRIVHAASDWLTSGRHATVDTIEPFQSAVSPRRPVELRDDGAVIAVLDLAIKVGSVVLDSGSGSIDTENQIRYVASLYGLDQCEVNVTLNSIIAAAQRGPTLSPITSVRIVHSRSLDFTRLAQVDRLVRRIRTGAMPVNQAHAEIDAIIAAPHPYPRWAATIAFGVMAAAFGLVLGGDWVVATVAFGSTVVTDRIGRVLNRYGIPYFFQQVAGGFLGTMPAAILYRFQDDLGIEMEPQLVIAAGIIVLLTGQSLVGSVQDAITGAPITGVGRFFEVLLMTGGIIGGVGLALRLLDSFDISLPSIEADSAFGFAAPQIIVPAAAIASLAYAYSTYSEFRALPAAAMGGAVGTIVYTIVAHAALGPVYSSGIAAVVVGFVGGLLARRALTPPIIVALSGITPLLPGLAIYRGLYGLLSEQTLLGLSALGSAIATGCALAAGVTLGEFIARALRRPRLHVADAARAALRRTSIMRRPSVTYELHAGSGSFPMQRPPSVILRRRPVPSAARRGDQSPTPKDQGRPDDHEPSGA